MLLLFYLVEEPPNAVKTNAAMWAFPWPVCVKSPTAFPFSAVTQLEFGVSHCLFVFCVCVHARPHPPARPSRLAKELRGGLVRRASSYALRSAHIAPRFAKKTASDTTYQYHLRVFMTTAYRQPTERGVHCLRPRFMPSRFAAVVGGPSLFRWPSWPGVARLSIIVHACHRENLINSFRTAAASKSESARGSARNRPRALSQTGISKRHHQVACRKARE